MFFLISGTAAAGKTTVVKQLPARVQRLECHDSDEITAHDEFERCQQLESWIQLALEKQENGIDFLFGAQSPLGELLACPSAPKLAGIAACVLDCSDMERVTRMRQRGIDPNYPPSQDLINWAAWHRLHAWDPQWEQRVILGNGPAEHHYAIWSHWQQGDPRWKVQRIDSTGKDIPWLLDQVEDWVKAERSRPSALSPQSKWWEA